MVLRENISWLIRLVLEAKFGGCFLTFFEAFQSDFQALQIFDSNFFIILEVNTKKLTASNV